MLDVWQDNRNHCLWHALGVHYPDCLASGLLFTKTPPVIGGPPHRHLVLPYIQRSSAGNVCLLPGRNRAPASANHNNYITLCLFQCSLDDISGKGGWHLKTLETHRFCTMAPQHADTKRKQDSMTVNTTERNRNLTTHTGRRPAMSQMRQTPKIISLMSGL